MAVPGRFGDHARLSSRARASLLAAVAVALLAGLVLLQYGPGDHPLIKDRAYFVYLGQALLRGEDIYHVTFWGYPPLAPLLTAGVIGLAEPFGVASWMAPRLAGVAVGCLCVAAMFLVTRNALRSVYAGVLAGILLAGFGQLGRFSVASLEPKMLVVLFSLATCLALQKRRPALAGFTSLPTVSCSRWTT